MRQKFCHPCMQGRDQRCVSAIMATKPHELTSLYTTAIPSTDHNLPPVSSFEERQASHGDGPLITDHLENMHVLLSPDFESLQMVA
jgi:hypothetical protein